VGLYNIFEGFKTLAAIRVFAVAAGLVNIAHTALAAGLLQMLFNFLIAKRVAKTNKHGATNTPKRDQSLIRIIIMSEVIMQVILNTGVFCNSRHRPLK